MRPSGHGIEEREEVIEQRRPTVDTRARLAVAVAELDVIEVKIDHDIDGLLFVELIDEIHPRGP
jgi:hypothetical protein